MNDVHSAAQGYVRRGICVIPLIAGQKKPAVKWEEYQKRLPTEEEINCWFSSGDRNLAVVCGDVSGGLVIVDFEREADFNKFFNLDILNHTLVVKTPHGGIHVYLRETGEVPRRKIKVSEDPPVDLLGEGGYALAPPSIIDHRFCDGCGMGGTGQYVRISTTDEIMAQAGIYRLVVGRAKALGWKITREEAANIEDIERGVPEGMRNVSAFTYARYLLFEKQLDPAAVLNELLKWNRLNNPPLPEKEIKTVLKSAQRYPIKKRREKNEEEKLTDFEKAQLLIDKYTADLFIEESEKEPFIAIKRENSSEIHIENYALKSSEFDSLLNVLFYDAYGKGLRTEIRRDVAATLEARVFSSGKSRRLELLGWQDPENSRLLIDLGDPKWRVVEITDKGWKIITPEHSPFRRTELTSRLPEPKMVENPFDVLSNLVPKNIEADQVEEARIIIPVWVCSVVLTDIPRPILVFIGPHGSGKSVATRKIQRVFTDLDVQGLNANDIRDTVAKLRAGAVVSFDNVRKIPDETADLLSSAATGAQMIQRELFTDLDIRVAQMKRAIMFNGIGPNYARYPDLTDRIIAIRLRRLENGERQEERTITEEFESVRPKLLGAAFTALANAFTHLDKVRAELTGKSLPRMADWAIWGEAIARGLGMPPFKFINAYHRLIREATITVLEELPLGKAM
ncbi:MAG: bifunctional DNA primase/polymerase, partial [Candidatus Hadarchaeum sp.]